MNKTELARSLAKEFDLSIVKSNEVVAYILDSMTKSLVKNKPVQLFGFGSFTVKKRKARAGRNPQTGELSIVF